MLRTWGRGGALQNLMGVGGPNSIHGGSMRGALNAVKNTCEGVHLIVVKLPAISLQACKFT